MGINEKTKEKLNVINDDGKVKSLKEIALSMLGYCSASILGPLVFFGGIGMLLDRRYDTSPKILIFGVLVAFVVSNILLIKKIRVINKMIEKTGGLPQKAVNDVKKEDSKEDSREEDNKKDSN